MEIYLVVAGVFFVLSGMTLGMIPAGLIIELFDSHLSGDNVWPLCIWYGIFFPIGILLSGYLITSGNKIKRSTEDQLFRTLLINLTVPLTYGIILYIILKSLIY
ncbi:hypothetical protein [Leptospira wolbachii]|uniref:hypothetical protein n=1 Tax=Leptospira wolbachii TaxID=29511 RepID=UPI00058BA568|nr:hypothetical protein [Leptospira wolbachii]